MPSGEGGERSQDGVGLPERAERFDAEEVGLVGDGVGGGGVAQSVQDGEGFVRTVLPLEQRGLGVGAERRREGIRAGVLAEQQLEADGVVGDIRGRVFVHRFDAGEGALEIADVEIQPGQLDAGLLGDGADAQPFLDLRERRPGGVEVALLERHAAQVQAGLLRPGEVPRTGGEVAEQALRCWEVVEDAAVEFGRTSERLGSFRTLGESLGEFRKVGEGGFVAGCRLPIPIAPEGAFASGLGLLFLEVGTGEERERGHRPIRVPIQDPGEGTRRLLERFAQDGGQGKPVQRLPFLALQAVDGDVGIEGGGIVAPLHRQPGIEGSVRLTEGVLPDGAGGGRGERLGGSFAFEQPGEPGLHHAHRCRILAQEGEVLVGGAAIVGGEATEVGQLGLVEERVAQPLSALPEDRSGEGVLTELPDVGREDAVGHLAVRGQRQRLTPDGLAFGCTPGLMERRGSVGEQLNAHAFALDAAVYEGEGILELSGRHVRFPKLDVDGRGGGAFGVEVLEKRDGTVGLPQPDVLVREPEAGGRIAVLGLRQRAVVLRPNLSAHREGESQGKEEEKGANGGHSGKKRKTACRRGAKRQAQARSAARPPAIFLRRFQRPRTARIARRPMLPPYRTPPASSADSVQRLAILGSTGSIGEQTLEIAALFPERLHVAAMTAGSNVEKLAAQARAVRPDVVGIADESKYRALVDALDGTGITVRAGAEALCEIAAQDGVDTVVAAIVGAAGLRPTLAAIDQGKTIALANKETLVVAGALVRNRAAASGAVLLPVDSEHSAIFQCLIGEDLDAVESLILTASGGPFRTRSADTFEAIRVEDALAHPNWTMGAKITIDSATLMNKGLEVIEARWLFGLGPDQIDVLVHPQSIIHSMVAFRDGSTKAQLGVPDMKVPIQYALTYPDRWPAPHERVDWHALGQLDFEPPDLDRFPCLGLAFEALRKDGTVAATLNAANEVAVALFLDGSIRFTDIPRLIEAAMAQDGGGAGDDLEALLAADTEARRTVRDRARTVGVG